MSLDSPMLNVETMKFMYETYVKNYEIEDEDPFLNTIKVNNFILNRIKSKIRIFCLLLIFIYIFWFKN